MPKTESVSERTCIVTRNALGSEALIRFVVGPNQQLVPDVAGKLPGRGIYVSASKLLVAEAIAKRLFSKAAKTQVQIPEGLLGTPNNCWPTVWARLCRWRARRGR